MLYCPEPGAGWRWCRGLPVLPALGCSIDGDDDGSGWAAGDEAGATVTAAEADVGGSSGVGAVTVARCFPFGAACVTVAMSRDDGTGDADQMTAPCVTGVVPA